MPPTIHSNHLHDIIGIKFARSYKNAPYEKHIHYIDCPDNGALFSFH